MSSFKEIENILFQERNLALIDVNFITILSSGLFTHKFTGEQLLTPSKIYSKVLLPVLRSGNVKAFIHIAEGGLLGRFPQILSEQFSIILGK